MSRRPKNVFLHFLNRDTQQIFGLEARKEIFVHNDLKKCINASLLLCDDNTFCIMPIGFWFESNYTRMLLLEYPECIEADFIRFSIREESIVEYIEKKREQYKPFSNQESQKDAYEKFYHEDVFMQFMELNPRLIDRRTKIGRKCSNLWTLKHNEMITDNSGELLRTYKSIDDLHERRKIGEAIRDVVLDPERPFIWSSVGSIIEDLLIKDPLFKKELRIQFEKSYYTLYLNEYDAVNLYNCHMDKGIDFEIGLSEDSIANYLWFELYLEGIDLKEILNTSDEKLVKIKKSRYWVKIFDTYLVLCNLINDKNNSFSSILSHMKIDDELEEAISKIKEILMNNNIITTSIGDGKLKKQRYADVLVMVATHEEEEAIKQCENWTSKKTKDGYEYFISKNGSMTFALAKSIGMGGTSSSTTTQLFADFINPRYYAMAGFCAGRKNKVNLGDVFVPEKIYQYDVGKQLSDTELLPEINSFTLDPLWIQKIERFGNEWRKTILLERPITYESQMKRFIEMMQKNHYEMKIIDLRNCSEIPNSTSIINDGCNNGLLSLNKGYVSATEKGVNSYENMYAMDYYGYIDPELTIRMGALATGEKVQQWDQIFKKLEKQYDRKTYALDMEGYAVAYVAKINHAPYIIAKGVGDFASGSKEFDNRFIDYSSVAAFKFIVAFFNSLEGTEFLER